MIHFMGVANDYFLMFPQKQLCDIFERSGFRDNVRNRTIDKSKEDDPEKKLYRGLVKEEYLVIIMG